MEEKQIKDSKDLKNLKDNESVLRNNAILICVIILLIGSFVAGIKCGQNDERKIQENYISDLVYDYENQISDLERELEAEKEIEHVEIEYVPVSNIEIDMTVMNKYEYAAIMIAKVIHGEANGCGLTQKALVAWSILNRYDSGRYGSSIESVITSPNQYHGYNSGNPVTEENYNVARDVIIRWYYEKNGFIGTSGRILPYEYTSFHGDGKVNHFTGKDADGEWDLSWGTVYTN